MKYQTIEKDGFKFIVTGKGKPIVLLHGLMGALSNWEAVIDHFSDRYQVLAPVFPVHDIPLITLGVKSLRKYLRRFFKYNKLDDVVIVGNSLGGHVGLAFTLAYPEHVKGLVLTGSSGLYENAFGGTYPRRKSYDYIREKIEFTFYDRAIATKELVDEIFETLNDRAKALRILTLSKSAIRNNLSAELPAITVPVLLIWGKEDRVTPPDVAEEFRSLLLNSELIWIDKCGHVPMMEQPVLFNFHLDAFLQKINSGGETLRSGSLHY